MVLRESAMAVAAVLDFEGATLEQYDEVIARMNFSPGGPGAPGGMFHWCTATETGIRVTDVWESREQFDAFATDHIGPITASVGVPAPPTITMFNVHNYLTAGAR
jgi:hypothetical protein